MEYSIAIPIFVFVLYGMIFLVQKFLEKVDPSIEGGFIFDINDFRLDASIATQLKRVKQQFIDKNRRIV